MAEPFQSIGFVGAGRTATALSLAMHGAGYLVAAVASRSQESARRLAGRLPGCEALPSVEAVTARCDVVFLTVPDAAISSVAEALPWREGQGAVHCSGALPLTALDSARDRGAYVGGLHPLQTFAGDGAGARGLTGTTFAVEGDGPLREWLEGLVKSLGGNPVRISQQDRPLYHAAAVMSCGYLTTMMDAASELWQGIGFSREDALQALLPLARGTLNNVESQGTHQGATGPIVRGDVETVRLHLDTLARRAPNVLPLYCQAGLAMVSMAAPQDTVSELTELLTSYLTPVKEPVGG